MKSYLTVEDILQRKHFEKVEIAAGKEGLHHHVKWVHIVEVTNIGKLLKGNELILSTAVAWKEKKELFISILQQLIKSNAAGLCIEIGTYTSVIPHEIITMANKAQFPIILILKEVPFVEITQDIHTLLINRQYDMLASLEKHSQVLNKMLLSMNHYDEILKVIYEDVQAQIILTFNNQENHFFPEIGDVKKSILLKAIETERSAILSKYSIVSAPIELLGEKYAELLIISQDRDLIEFDQLILDRTANALAQFFIRELFVEEKRRVEETEWVNCWLDGEETKASIMENLAYYMPTVSPKGAFVCIYQQEEQKKIINLTYFKLYFRSILEQRGFSFLAIEKHHSVILIIINERQSTDWKKRVNEAISKLLESELERGRVESKPMIGVGKYVENLEKVSDSYQTAIETVKIKKSMADPANSYFYDDLHIFRVISILNRQLDLQEIVMEYLEPVISYDFNHNGKLMDTLKAYLACNGSKKETAQKLFIVRQTLYHRLEKLEQLLGTDFMTHEKRLAIEFMVMSHEFILASNQEFSGIKKA
ncbi:PucR family transcriptional regulator [Cytobacillus purgationiresistens]|uniref:Purine catabolism regulator n=1 Tax=Cytobacillus purgationiresistens TaxID=863449 RepID=A0ABU0ABU9_9BACI|nr:PucR family transcriptional regulator [Cytobacillus purgationiresistens]MDQ0268267.1 purine catabolism regulator [Cytobacillus purgationiresistens]